MCEDRSIFLSGLPRSEEPLDISRENMELLNMYIRDIHKSELLTKEEEQDLIPQVQWLSSIPEIAHIVRIVTGHEASLEEALIFLANEDKHELRSRYRKAMKIRDKIVFSNLKLVIKVAKKHVNKGLDLVDLIQEGSIGLLRAIQKFDCSKNFKFSTYAVPWIKQGITRALHDKSRMIRLPVHMGEAVNKARRIHTSIEQQNDGIAPPVGQVADQLGISAKLLKDLLTLDSEFVSLDHSMNPYSDDSMDSMKTIVLDTIKIDDNVVENIYVKDMRCFITNKARNVLSERDYSIFSMAYGFDGDPVHHYVIAQIFQLTRERVRMIVSAAEKKIRSHLHEFDPDLACDS